VTETEQRSNALAARLVATGLVARYAIVARETPLGGSELVAYVVPSGTLSPEQWSARLRERLPEASPDLVVAVTHLPLTPDGAIGE
jgi:acyl-coenzyme A synthetase/AMP-(fatty) acid ligase